MWKDKVIKQSPRDRQLRKNLEGFINEIESIKKRLEEMPMFVPLPPRVEMPLREVFGALRRADELFRDALDEV